MLPGVPITSDLDARHLARAVELAERGWPDVSPNPLVGAVIASGEETLGEGFTGRRGTRTPRWRRSARRRA